MSFSDLFEQFVRERIYLKNVTPKTVRYHRQSWDALCRMSGGSPEQLNKALLAEFVVKLREAGIKPVSCNTYISSINAFLAWLHENGHLADRLKVKKLKVEQNLIKTLTDQQVRAILNFKPETSGERRVHVLSCLLLDTGIRIDEALSLRSENVRFDDLYLIVRGKGQKERVVPFSPELRKVLWRYQKQRPQHELSISTRTGGKLSYHNMRRDFRAMCEKLGIFGIKGSFHLLRHTFATNYMEEGGSEIFLSKILGHTTLQMTHRYTHPAQRALQEVHRRTSLLERLRR